MTALLDLVTSKWVLVKGASMSPTIRDGQRVRVSRRSYANSKPERWDIVLFEHPHRDGFWETKRIVGLPGEVVNLQSGSLYIDGVEIEDAFRDDGLAHSELRLSLGCEEYAVMGDNRRYSTDSRAFGAVHRNRILGKVMLSD